ncbi:MAG: glycosyltransferase family 4 protein [Methylotenera sp.]|nr:glycosyltransferase family 4 protein [Methylotenera sp.]
MKKNLHLSHTDIVHDSRILKEMKAAENSGYQVSGIGIKLTEGTRDSKYFDQSKIISIPLFVKKWTFLPKPLRHLLTLIEFLFRSFFKAVKVKPDIIHCHDTLVLPIGFLVKVFTKAKLVYDAHELESNRNGLSPFLGKLTLWVEKILWRFVDGLIVVSPSIEKWYQDNVGAKLSTVVFNSPVIDTELNGVDSNGIGYLRTTFGISEDQKVFLYIGILGKGRGIELLLDAFKDKQIRSHLVFLGYGDMSDYLKSESRKYTNIHVHDAVPHEKVVPVAQSADVGLCLIENVSLSDYYCLPNKLFEYCFAGLPVLASNFPDISSVVEQFQLGTVTSLDVNSVKEAIFRFENNEVDIGFSIDDLHPLSWDAQARNLLGLYNQVLDKQ